VELAGRPAHAVRTAETYFGVGTHVGLDWLRDQIEQLSVEGPWQAVARTELRVALSREHRRLAEHVLAHHGRGGLQAQIRAWLARSRARLEHWQRMLTEMRAAGDADFATLSVGVESLRRLLD